MDLEGAKLLAQNIHSKREVNIKGKSSSNACTKWCLIFSLIKSWKLKILCIKFKLFQAEQVIFSLTHYDGFVHHNFYIPEKKVTQSNRLSNYWLCTTLEQNKTSCHVPGYSVRPHSKFCGILGMLALFSHRHRLQHWCMLLVVLFSDYAAPKLVTFGSCWIIFPCASIQFLKIGFIPPTPPRWMSADNFLISHHDHCKLQTPLPF